MDKTILGIALLCLSACHITPEGKEKPSPVITNVARKTPNLAGLIKKPIQLSYQELLKEPVFKNLNLIGKTTKYGVVGDSGKILRVERFENIAHAVEKRYRLPTNILLAMIAHETGGEVLLPNAHNDGGFGLCHMQPSLAVQFSLKTYQNCKSLRSTAHGIALRKEMDKAGSMKNAVTLDDRLHPILNLDAAGRMIAYYMYGPKLKGLDSFQTAICRYAGKYNYKKYLAEVNRFMNELNDINYISGIENSFNKKNPNFLINNTPGNFKKYIEECQKQNYNYGLARYENLGVFDYDWMIDTVRL